MQADEYQEYAAKTAMYPKGQALEYLILGLASEAGELAGKLKKAIRDNDGIISDDIAEAIIDEGGDCQWYIAMIAMEMGYTLSHLMDRNIEKLGSRAERGVIGGSGDYR